MMGGESLTRICSDPTMPGRSTVYDWLADKKKFRDMFAIARELQIDFFTDRMIEIFDSVLAGKITPDAANIASKALMWQADSIMLGRRGAQVANSRSSPPVQYEVAARRRDP